jgi:hypothetical protein
MLILIAVILLAALLFAISRETKLDDTETEDCAYAGHCTAVRPCSKDKFHPGTCCYCGTIIDEALGEARDEL